MGVDAEKLFREALDEPAPPPPADPIEDEGDDHGHVCRPPSLIVFGDGAVTTAGPGGTLLVAGFALGLFAAAWLACSWLWSVLTLPVATLTLQIAALLSVLFLASAGTVLICQRVVQRWRR